jgi:hypothetical protein
MMDCDRDAVTELGFYSINYLFSKTLCVTIYVYMSALPQEVRNMTLA